MTNITNGNWDEEAPERFHFNLTLGHHHLKKALEALATARAPRGGQGHPPPEPNAAHHHRLLAEAKDIASQMLAQLEEQPS